MNTTEANIENIRQQLAQLPPDVLDRIHDALRHHSIAHAGSLLWKAGVGLSSADTYEYRMTLFPPGAMVDPYTAGPPVLQPSTCLPR